MSNKILNITALIFIIFAIVQYNDPDWFIWIPAYLIPAIFCLKQDLLRHRWLLLLSIVGFVIWMATYIPDFIDWIKNGTPSITGTMKAENPEVELTREFFGLIICNFTLIYLYFKSTKTESQA